MAAAAPQLALPSGEREVDSSVTTYGVIILGVAALVGVVAMVGAWLTLRYDSKVWPAKGFVIQDYYGNVLLVTMLMAGVAGWWALFGVVKNERRQSAMALGLVIFLEGAFINLITYVLRSSKLSPTKSAFGVIYYGLDGLMIALAIVGILVAAVTLARVLGGQVSARESGLGWAAAWFTTIVLLAWIAVYLATYVFI
jgi:heme/copper-type cytochrome/quinol oxidase subunit 3